MAPRKRARASLDLPHVVDMSPPPAAMPSIDEYDLAGLFTQSMDAPTVQLDASSRTESSGGVKGFESVMSKLGSFNARRSMSLSTVSTSESPAETALVPVGENNNKSATDVLAVPTSTADAARGQIGYTTKIGFEVGRHSLFTLRRFDVFFENFQNFIFPSSFPVKDPGAFSEAYISVCTQLRARPTGWMVIQVPGAFSSASGTVVVQQEDVSGELVAYVCGSVVRMGSRGSSEWLTDLDRFGVADVVRILPVEDAVAGDDEDEDEVVADTEDPTVMIRGDLNVFGFLDFLRPILAKFLIDSAGKRSPTLIASAPFSNATCVHPKVRSVAGEGATYTHVEGVVFPIRSVCNILLGDGSPFGSAAGAVCSLTVDSEMVKKLNPSNPKGMNNVVKFAI